MNPEEHRRILEKSWETDKLLHDTCKVFGVLPKDLPKTCKRFKDMVEEQHRTLEVLKRK